MATLIIAIGTVLLVILTAMLVHATGVDGRLWRWLQGWRVRWPLYRPRQIQPLSTVLGPPDADGDSELRRFLLSRFHDIPLRQHEIDMLQRVLWWAIENPLDQFLTGNDALDIGVKPERRPSTQLWHMPLPMVGAYPRGLESDESLSTLVDCHRRLNRLIEEVRHDEAYWLGRSKDRRFR